MHLNVYSSIIYNNQPMERAQMSIDWSMDSQKYIQLVLRKIQKQFNGGKIVLPTNGARATVHPWSYIKFNSKWITDLNLKCKIIKLLLSYFFLTFIYFFETERDRAWTGEGQRERDTESETGSRLWAVSTEPYTGLKFTSCEIMSWADVRCLTDWATQVPPSRIFLVLAEMFNSI